MHLRSKQYSLCPVVLILVVHSGIAFSQTRPQDDFYTHINADWLENTPIPDNLPGIDNFTHLALKVNAQLQETLESLRNSDSQLEDHEQKLLGLYLSYIDQEHRDELGVKPIEQELRLIADCKDHKSVSLAFAQLQKFGIAGPVVLPVLSDPGNSIKHAVTAIQYGLGPTQAVLIGEDERSKRMRLLYQEHMANLFALAGIPNAEERAPRVLELEEKLARIQWTPAQNRDPQKTYNPMSFAQFQELLSNFQLEEMFSNLGFDSEQGLVVQQPSYLKALDKLFVATDVANWQDYLRMRTLSERAQLLSSEFREEMNAYRRKRGLSSSEIPLGLRAVLFLGDQVEMLAGRVYVEHHFRDDELEQITELVRIIKEEYRLAISGSTLFSDATKKEALEKLGKMTFYVGYPREWKDYSTVRIDPRDLVGNARRVSEFKHQELVQKASQPVDPDEWLASPIEVNAFYHPPSNKFVLMAAILQPPFFDSEWSVFSKLGGIGFIVGHEIGHGFDDRGSRYDADGNLRNWWTAEDRRKFQTIAMRAVKQADAYEILPGHFLNGRLELGEILGDLNGLHISHRASRRIAKEKGIDPKQSDREFFEQAAQSYRDHFRESLQIKLIETDGHPPGKYRVNGIFPHLDAFHELYQTNLGDGMYLPPEDRLKIW